jgi:uncharacterized protein involved in exopolysaccharide biosynthesis
MIPENISQKESIHASTEPSNDEGIDFLDLILIVVENLRLLVIGSIVAGLAALGIGFTISPTYTAKTQFLPPQQQQSSASALVQSMGVGSIGGLSAGLAIKNPADQYIAFLKSQSLQDAMVDRFDLMSRYSSKFREDARKILSENTKITSSPKEGVIAIEVDDSDPTIAADIANGYAEELRRLMNRLALTEAQIRRTFFEKKLKETRSNLSEAEESLRGTGVSRGILKTSPGAAVEIVARLKAALTVQEIKVASMRGYLAETSPEFLQAMKEMIVLKDQLYSAEKADTSVGDGLYVTRYRQFKYQETLYELFSKQYELARIDESREGVAIQIIDLAQIPEKKSKPNKGRITIIAAISTLLMLLIYIYIKKFIIEFITNSKNLKKINNIKTSLKKLKNK